MAVRVWAYIKVDICVKWSRAKDTDIRITKGRVFVVNNSFLFQMTLIYVPVLDSFMST